MTPTVAVPPDVPNPVVTAKRGTTLGTWALILGLLAVLFAVIPSTSEFGIFVAVVAVVALVLGGIGPVLLKLSQTVK